MKKNNRSGLYISFSPEDKKIMGILKSKFAINISQMIKNHLSETLKRLEDDQKTKK